MAGPLGFATSLQRSSRLAAAGTPPRRNSPSQKTKASHTSNSSHPAVIIFLVGLAIPWIIPLGSLNLSVYRLVLLTFLLPCLWSWCCEHIRRHRVPDVALLLYSAWAGIALLAAHGMRDAARSSGILFIETMGAYLLARRYVRNSENFRGMVSVMAAIVLSPITVCHLRMDYRGKPILWALGTVFPTVEATLMSPRWGFGAFRDRLLIRSSSASSVRVSLRLRTLLWTRSGVASRWVLTGSVAGTAFLCMSSAPLMCLLFQVMLLGYNWIFRHYSRRWTILWGIAFVGYLIVVFGSNQSAVKFFISRFTFDPQTGWWRLAIWDYGSASVLNHPLLGIGLSDWQRPRWMVSDSVDNFWLLTAMRYGVPAVILLLVSCLWMTLSVMRATFASSRVEICRLAYLMCMTTFLFVGTTIHFSHAIYAWFMFILGSGAWFLDVTRPAEGKSLLNPPARGAYSRSRNPRQQSRLESVPSAREAYPT